MEFFDPTSPIVKIIVAALLGIFLGIRRENVSKKVDFLGIRTLSIIGMLGCLSTFFPSFPTLPLLMFAGLLVFVIIVYLYGVKIGRIGLTSELSVFMVFLVGALIGYEQFILALVITVILAVLLAFKEELHLFAHTITRKEWTGALQLIVISGIILPFLPREAIDPWGVVNPFSIWLFVIFITGIGFIGYFLIKYLGTRSGVLLKSLIGSLVSSTAVVNSISAESRHQKSLSNIFVVGVWVAILVMHLRVAVEILTFGAPGIYIIALVPVVMAMVLLFFVAQNFINAKKTTTKDISGMELSNPFKILPALLFGGILVIVLFLVHFFKVWFGDSGLYFVSFLSAIVDIDAIILSGLESFKSGFLGVDVVRNTIFVSVISGTIIKALYAGLIGSWAFARKVLPPIVFSVLAGLLVLIFII